MTRRSPKKEVKRIDCLIPPLPQSKLMVDKEKARSPIGKGGANNGTVGGDGRSASPYGGDDIVVPLERRVNKNHVKMNVSYDNNRGLLAPLPFAMNATLQRGDKNVKGNFEKKLTSPSYLVSSTPNKQTLTEQSTRHRVLRYRETIETLFCWSDVRSEEYRTLCRSIVEGDKANCISTWLRMLSIASSEFEKVTNNVSDSGRKILRIYRRAVVRFPITPQINESANMCQLWHSFSEILAKYGLAEESRQVFKKMRENGLNANNVFRSNASMDTEDKTNQQQLNVSFHQRHTKNKPQAFKAVKTTRTEFQKPLARGRKKHGNFVTTIPDTIREGPGSQPNKDVGIFLRKRIRIANKVTEDYSVVDSPQQECTGTKKALGSDDDMSLTVSEHDEKLLNEGSITANRKRKNEGFILPSIVAERSQITKLSADQVGNGSADNQQTSQTKNGSSALRPEFDKQKCTRLKNPTTPINPDAEEPNAVITRMSSSRDVVEGTNENQLTKKPGMLSKTPRLGRLGFSGKAQRVGAESTLEIESDSDESDEDLMDKPANTSTKVKFDIGYMWKWNPDERVCAKRKQDEEESEQQKEGKATKIAEEKFPPAPIGSQPSSFQAKKSAQSSSTDTSEQSDRSQPSTISSISSGGTTRQSMEKNESSMAVSPRTAKLISNSNPDFLPLVSESNIIKVNNAPYMKLGVVGKGGSSKVYRALARDCTVVAIKKVKLSGMNKKVVEGYVNEIALLKRLRKNPAIIQMFDSEVCPSRKALFVVMEAGEVDLNHILHNQRVGEDKALNMNFIRLTWQQMLNAVHCIHEERIIHGDLKPANFLFVRGALKLIDFGIAKAIQSEDTTNIYRDSQIGTLNYMSPEAILNTESEDNGSQREFKCGRASDIWSLGCILYQMVYGNPPFASLHMISKLRAIVDPNHNIKFPRTMNNYPIDEAAIDAIKQCLQRTPQDRPPIVGKLGLLNQHRFLNSSLS